MVGLLSSVVAPCGHRHGDQGEDRVHDIPGALGIQRDRDTRHTRHLRDSENTERLLQLASAAVPDTAALVAELNSRVCRHHLLGDHAEHHLGRWW